MYSSSYDSKRDHIRGISYSMDSALLGTTPNFNDQPRNPFKTSRILSLISAILCTFSIFLLAILFSLPFLFIQYRLLKWSSYLFSVTSVLDFQFPLKTHPSCRLLPQREGSARSAGAGMWSIWQTVGPQVSLLGPSLCI